MRNNNIMIYEPLIMVTVINTGSKCCQYIVNKTQLF